MCTIFVSIYLFFIFLFSLFAQVQVDGEEKFTIREFEMKLSFAISREGNDKRDIEREGEERV